MRAKSEAQKAAAREAVKKARLSRATPPRAGWVNVVKAIPRVTTPPKYLCRQIDAAQRKARRILRAFRYSKNKK